VHYKYSMMMMMMFAIDFNSGWTYGDIILGSAVK